MIIEQNIGKIILINALGKGSKSAIINPHNVRNWQKCVQKCPKAVQKCPKTV